MFRRCLQFESLESRIVMATGVAKYVIAISVDGLHPEAITALGEQFAPNFHRLRREGAFTHNARTDADQTTTLPNHAGQITSRPVVGGGGHNLTENVDPGGTLHDQHGAYVASVFDVVHDAGKSTALYASKTKFALFDRSWNEIAGAPDTTGLDNGRDKIDDYIYAGDTQQLVQSYVASMSQSPYHFSLIHLLDPDSAGHAYGWMSSQYLEAVARVDAELGQIMNLLDTAAELRFQTSLILTTDHGGEGPTHVDPSRPNNYTIPFYVWGAKVRAGGDLYDINSTSRADPGGANPSAYTQTQPLRNADLANLALDLLGLPAIPGSTYNQLQDLETDAALSPSSPWWQNPLNRFDVNGDGQVFPLDVLLVINALNSGGGARTLPAPSGSSTPPPYIDVSGDNFLAPVDALMVINELNHAGAGEGEAARQADRSAYWREVDVFFESLDCDNSPQFEKSDRHAPRSPLGNGVNGER